MDYLSLAAALTHHLSVCSARKGIEDTLENSKAALMDFQNLVKDLGPLGYILYIGAVSPNLATSALLSSRRVGAMTPLCVHQ